MVMYCTCGACVAGPAQPNNVVQGDPEQITGPLVTMAVGWTLAHWSSAAFGAMSTREILNFQRLGHKLRTGCSFFLYHGAAPPVQPAALTMFGLGGANRYTVDHVQGADMLIYRKVSAGAVVPAPPIEVAVMVGCGGSIPFDGAGQATGYNAVDQTPMLTR